MYMYIPSLLLPLPQHADGDIFVGQWKENAAHGFGIYYHKKGQTTYGGQWVDDLQHGHGVEQC